MHHCVGVNPLLLWRMLNLFRFGGRKDFQSSQLLGPIDAALGGSAAHFHRKLNLWTILLFSAISLVWLDVAITLPPLFLCAC